MFPNLGYLRLWYSDPSWDLDKVIQFRVTWFDYNFWVIFAATWATLKDTWFDLIQICDPLVTMLQYKFGQLLLQLLGNFRSTLGQFWAQLAMLWILTLSNLNSRLLGSMAGFELWLDFRWSDFWYNLNIRLRLGSRFWLYLNTRLLAQFEYQTAIR